jgi:hypothetical protein
MLYKITRKKIPLNPLLSNRETLLFVTFNIKIFHPFHTMTEFIFLIIWKRDGNGNGTKS